MGALLLLVLLAAGALLPFGHARAQDVSQCMNASYSGTWCPDEASAYAGALAAASRFLNGDNHLCGPDKIGPFFIGGIDAYRIRYMVQHNNFSCGTQTFQASGERDFAVGASCPKGYSVVTGQCYPEDCASKPPGTIPSHYSAGTKQCVNQCTRTLYPNGDGSSQYVYSGQNCEVRPSDCEQYNTANQHYVWNQYFQVCQPVVPECPQGKTAQNGVCVDQPDCPAGQFLDGQGICQNAKEECPAGQIKSPEGNCLPGDGSCAAGEARKKDGTCGKDGNNDGKADDEDEDPDNDTDKNEFTGGDNCKQPPTCNGDPIMCGQARIQWRIECNTRKNRNVAGGTCDRPPECTGEKCDAVEVAQLNLQWRTACALEKAKTGGGTTPADSAVVDWLTQARAADINAANQAANEPDGTEGINEADAWHTFDNSSFNPGMFGGDAGGTCSFTTQLSLMGEPIDLGPDFWMLAGMIGWLVVAAAYLWVAAQLGG